MKYFESLHFLRMSYILVLLLCLTSSPALSSNFPENPKIGQFFGVQIKHWRTSDDELRTIKETGFKYVRIDMNWEYVEKSSKNYDWSAYDEFFPRLEAHGLGAIVILKGGNIVYSDPVPVDPKTHWGATERPPAPNTEAAVLAFSEFAAKASERYKNKNIIWEIWNEPDWFFWIPEPDPAAYARLASEVCSSIKEKNSEALVVGPGLAKLPGDPQKYRYRTKFIKEFLQSPAIECIDAISLHPYRGNDSVPESVIQDYKEVRDYIQGNIKQGVEIPTIISSEWGYTLTNVTQEQQEAYVLRTHLSNLLANVPMSILYEWKDSHNSEAGNSEANFGIVKHDRQAKLSFLHIETILPSIKDAVIERRIETNNQDLYFLLLRYPDGKYGLLYWSSTKNDLDLTAEIDWQDTKKYIDIKMKPQLVKTDNYIPEITVID